MAWARIEGDRVVEITEVDPDGRYHPDLAWAPCGSSVVVGMIFSGGEFFEEAKRVPTRAEIEGMRLIAYADPVRGSDRHFAEVVRLQTVGAGDAEIATAREAGLARYAEIQAAYPWPDEHYQM